MKNLTIYFTLIPTFLFLISCSNQDKKKPDQKTKVPQEQVTKRVSVISIESPKSGEMFTIGDKVDLDIRLKNSEVKVDSLIIEHDDFKKTFTPENMIFSWETGNLKTGSNQIKVLAYSSGHKIDSYYLKLRFKSDIIPELYECQVIETYPHDKKAYTQGLIFEDGIMYEGTGDWANSSLRKVDYKTGNVQAILSLGGGEYFGEGITIFKDKIIQLTWKSKTGFIYDKNSFSLLRKFKYPTEGWGLTTYHEKLIMSDGTNSIHFLDPEYLNEITKIEIYDNNGPVEYLNELEYVNGLVYANVYLTEEIIAFDPETGKVLERIDCSKIIPKGYENEHDNVLNGIAYDKKNDLFFITGKRWPILFEVKFVRK